MLRLTFQQLEPLSVRQRSDCSNRSTGLMGSTRDIFMRTVYAIVALVLVFGAPALAFHGAHAAGHHAAGSMPSAAKAEASDHRDHSAHAPSRHDRNARSAQKVAHCPFALAPVHCEICLARDLVQTRMLRKRDHGLGGQSMRCGWMALKSVDAANVDVGRPPLARPPDGPPVSSVLTSRPLSLAYRFRI